MIKIHTTKCRFLMRAIFILGSVYFASAQPLPVEWWKQSSPEDILTKAQTITSNLTYLHGIKVHPMGDKNISLEFFQRKNINGIVETKEVLTQLMENHPRVSADYNLESGRYYYQARQLIKSEFDKPEEFRQKMAAKFDRPFIYQMRKSELVGTNDCIVIVRIMSLPLFEAVTAEVYKEFPPEMRMPEWKNLMIRGYPFERNYYLRKSDGVIMGFREKNKEGLMSDDQGLYDTIQVNVPIPDQEFALPTAPVRIAHSWPEWDNINVELSTIVAAEIRSKYRGEILSRHHKVLAVIAIPSVLLPLALWLVFRRRGAKAG
jgi:hypothetical protein